MSIQVEHLSHVYAAGTPAARVALEDISLRIEDGSAVAVVGVTGSGKSTLVQHFNGLLRPSAGRVVVNGTVLEAGGKHSGREVRELRRKVGLLFQRPESQLFAATVFDDVAFGPRRLGLNPRVVRDRVHWAMDAVALGADSALLRRSPFALSGGQRRRVALAGVLAMRPKMLVLDEPSAGLDAEARNELFATLQALRRNEGITLVIVSHDMSEVASTAEVVFVLKVGTLRLAGMPADVFAQTDEILACGLEPPPLARLAVMARAAGWDIPTGTSSAGDLAEALAAQGRSHAD